MKKADKKKPPIYPIHPISPEKRTTDPIQIDIKEKSKDGRESRVKAANGAKEKGAK